MIDCLIDGSDFVVMVAADIVLCFDGDRLRRRKVAVSVGKRTAPGQRATGRQVDGARDLALERDGAGTFECRVRQQH